MQQGRVKYFGLTWSKIKECWLQKSNRQDVCIDNVQKSMKHEASIYEPPVAERHHPGDFLQWKTFAHLSISR
jgi:hypothetical protein